MEMSLNVYLVHPEKVKKTCFHCDSEYEEDITLYDSNITHNLTTMAFQAGIYKELWRPEEIGATHAKDIIFSLEVGLAKLKASAEYYSEFNATNGWGLYENFVPFVENYLNACKQYPYAIIKVSR